MPSVSINIKSIFLYKVWIAYNVKVSVSTQDKVKLVNAIKEIGRTGYENKYYYLYVCVYIFIGIWK